MFCPFCIVFFPIFAQTINIMKKLLFFSFLSISLSIQAQPIVPKTVKAEMGEGNFYLSKETVIIAADKESESAAELLSSYLKTNYNISIKTLPYQSDKKGLKSIIQLSATTDKDIPNEGYTLDINKQLIDIKGKKGGVFYATQSLKQLLFFDEKEKKYAFETWKITDYPRFAWRGMHLDVCRHFFPVDFVKKYIDVMAFYKMNTFHWHLTEDQGWRIEIKKYPLLTEIGGTRKETMIEKNFNPYKGDGIPYKGFYTQAEIKEVVEYARLRNVNIVPEIEMPGHSLAALAAYPELACSEGPFEVATIWGVFEDVYCPKEETFQFLENVLTEVCALFPGEYVHIGGDEVPKAAWKKSAVAQDLMKKEGLKNEEELQSYFIRRMEKVLQAKGKRLIGWDEILEGGLAPNATVMSWRGEEGGIAAAKMGHDVVMTPGAYCYFDHYQGPKESEPLAIGGNTTLEKVYSYNPLPPTLSPEEQKHILGAQANLWTEYITTTEHAEYMAYPRACALSEVLWSPVDLRNWDNFQSRMKFQYDFLQKMNVNVRIK